MTLPAEFSRFPKEWRVLPFLDAVADATGGNAKIKVEDYLEAGVLPIVDQGQELFNGYTDEPELACSTELPAIVFGDHTRRFKLIEEPFALGADGAKLLKPKEKFDPKFLYYYLNQLRIESAGYSRHYKFLKETYVPVPPLATQQHIARVLEQADQLRKQAQQMESELNQLAQSLFLEMFGDPVVNPKAWDIAELGTLVGITSGATPSKSSKRFWEGSFPWVSPKDMKKTEIDDAIDHINECVFNESNLKKIERDSILIVVRGMILAHTVPLAITTAPVAINQDIKALRLIDPSRVTPRYLLALLVSMHDKILSIASTAAHGTKRIETGDLCNLRVPIPPMRVQQKYCDIEANLRKQAQQANDAASHYEFLFQSLMQRAFNGELTAPERKAA